MCIHFLYYCAVVTAAPLLVPDGASPWMWGIRVARLVVATIFPYPFARRSEAVNRPSRLHSYPGIEWRAS